MAALGIVLGIIVSVFAIIGGVARFTSWGRERLARLRHWRRPWPRVALRIVGQEGEFRWAAGSEGDVSAMSVFGLWIVTGVAERQAGVASVYIKHRREEFDGHASASINHRGFDPASIQVGLGSKFSSVQISAHFWIPKVLADEGQPFKTTVVFVDTFENEYRKRATFKYAG